MPIAVKDYKWEESNTTLFITVPLKGVKPHKIDIFSTEDYVKVSYPPYIFECFLYAPVYDRRSAAQVGNGAVLFKLEKQTPAVWERIQTPDADDRSRQIELRETAVLRSQERTKEEKEERETRQRAHNKLGVSQQMKLEEVDRTRIEDLKESERQQATLELGEWKRRQQEMARQSVARESKRIKDKEQQINAERKKKVGIFQAGDQPLREAGRIAVAFTPRVFPTPVRESQTLQEEEWLKKQAGARQISQFDDGDLTDEEKNPVWLRDKGNSFFQAGNTHAAINAYSHAIRLDYKMPSLYSNRAACHLKLNNYMKATEDASKALDLLTPAVPLNAASRCKAHIRRGTALCHLELYVEGLLDYEAALKLDANNEQLIADASRIRAIIQGVSPT